MKSIKVLSVNVIWSLVVQFFIQKFFKTFDTDAYKDANL